MKYLIAILLILSLGSCAVFKPYSDKRVGAKIEKFNDKNPVAVAKTTRGLYPCIVDSVVKVDTFLKDVDLSWYFDMIDSLNSVRPLPADTVVKPDSTCVVLANKQSKYIKGLERINNQLKDSLKTRPIIYINTNTTVKDSTEIKEAYEERDATKKKYEKMEKNYNTNKQWKIYFLIAFLVSFILNIIMLILKFR